MPTFTFELEHPDKGLRTETLKEQSLERATDRMQVGGWTIKRQIANPEAQQVAKPDRVRPGPITQAEVYEAVFWAIIKAHLALAVIGFVIWLIVLAVIEGNSGSF